MKTFGLFAHAFAVFSMLTACESCGERIVYPAGESDMSGTFDLSINTKITASFIKSVIDNEGNKSHDGAICRLEQFGSGTDAELGAFDVYLTCCWNTADGSHSCTEGYITDYEGNMLTIKCNDGDNGVIFTSDFPYDQTFIGYEFEFTGGNGRFAGASGSGIIECEVKGNSNSMIHYWNASLTLLTEYYSL